MLKLKLTKPTDARSTGKKNSEMLVVHRIGDVLAEKTVVVGLKEFAARARIKALIII